MKEKREQEREGGKREEEEGEKEKSGKKEGGDFDGWFYMRRNKQRSLVQLES